MGFAVNPSPLGFVPHGMKIKREGLAAYFKEEESLPCFVITRRIRSFISHNSPRVFQGIKSDFMDVSSHDFSKRRKEISWPSLN